MIFLCRTEECPMGRCLLVPGAPHPTHGARPGPSCTAVLALGPEWPAGLSRVMLSVGTGSLAHLSVRFQARSLGQIERNCHGTGLRVDMGWHGARVSHLSRGDLSVRVVWCWGAPCVLSHGVGAILREGTLRHRLGDGWRQEGGREAREKLSWGAPLLGSAVPSLDMNLGKLQQMVRGREAWCAVVHGVSKSWTRLEGGTATILRMPGTRSPALL